MNLVGMKILVRVVVWTVLGAFWWTLSGCEVARTERFEYARIAMGVRCQITLYSPDEARARDAASGAFDEIARLEQIFSDYRASSEVSRLSDLVREGSRGEIHVSPDLAEILATAHEVSSRSGGAFDVTVGPCVQLWRESRTSGRLPDAAALASARAGVGWEGVASDPTTCLVTVSRGVGRFDLGGIAKGYAADRARRFLREHGHPSSLVALAGDIAVGDSPPQRDGWDIRVNPEQPGAPESLITLANACISTSGDTAQFVEIGGVRYAHLIDPRTGLGSTARRSVTVVTRCAGEWADAWASALAIAGARDGAAMLDATGISAMIGEIDDSGRFRQTLFDAQGLLIHPHPRASKRAGTTPTSTPE